MTKALGELVASHKPDRECFWGLGGAGPEALESQDEEVSTYLLNSSVWIYTQG